MHLQRVLELAGVKWSLGVWSFLFLSICLLLTGVIVGALWLQTVRGVVLLAVMGAGLPYLVLRFRVTTFQMRAQLDFLPAVETFYQLYTVMRERHPLHALGKGVEERRFHEPLLSQFEMLYRNLLTRRSMEESLQSLTDSMGHIWSIYFVNLLRLGIEEGIDISGGLQELVRDMRKAKVADAAERTKLLEIRVASFSPIVFLALFLYLNFRLNGKQAQYYYLVDSVGKGMLLDAAIMMSASFALGVYLSIQRLRG